jgi:hypothetical protein
MKIEVKRARLHTPLFLGGKNLGDHLDRTRGEYRDLGMFYDTEEQMLYVTWNKETTWIPLTNVANGVSGAPQVRAVSTPAQRAPIEAQVSTPQGHVHAGPGHGKTK